MGEEPRLGIKSNLDMENEEKGKRIATLTMRPVAVCKRKSGRMTVELARNIIAEREPELFDSDNIKERDAAIAKLLEKDKKLELKRNKKPVILTPSQHKLIVALCYSLWACIDEDDYKKMMDSLYYWNEIRFKLDLKNLSKVMNEGSARARETEKIFEDLQDLHETWQVQHLKGKNGKLHKIIRPLVMIAERNTDIEDIPEENNQEAIDPKKEGKEEVMERMDEVELVLGKAFFINAYNRYGYIPKKLFEIANKGKKGELWWILFDSILYVYWQYFKAYEKATSEEDRKEAMTLILRFDTIKKRLSIDYGSDRRYEARFIKDLREFIRDMKELGLIADARIIIKRERKTRGRSNDNSRVIFLLSPSYGEEGRLLEAIPG